MHDLFVPQSPPDCPPVNAREPWDVEPSPTAGRWIFALLVCGAVICALIIAFFFMG